MADVTGTIGNDVIHRAGDFVFVPAGYTDITGVTIGNDTINRSPATTLSSPMPETIPSMAVTATTSSSVTSATILLMAVTAPTPSAAASAQTPQPMRV